MISISRGGLLSGVQQLSLLGMMVAILAGLVGIVLLARLMQTFPSRFLRAMLYCLLLFNLLIIFGLAFRYLQLHVLKDLPQSWQSAMVLTTLNLLAVLKLGFVYFFLEMNTKVAGSDLPVRFRKVFLIGAAFLMGVLITVSVGSPFLPDPNQIAFFFEVFEILIIVAILSIVLQQFGRSLGLVNRKVKLASLSFSLVHVVVFVAMTAIFLLSLDIGASSEQPTSYALLNSLAMVFYNILLVSWAFRYIPVLEVVSASNRERISDRLVKKFGITNRERQIIELICQGMTNQEIANSLFISLQTVKDHNYNIFRKTGVSNRVQIARLFSKS